MCDDAICVRVFILQPFSIFNLIWSRAFLKILDIMKTGS